MSSPKKITNFKKHQILEHETESLEFIKILIENIPKNNKKLESLKNTFAMQKSISTLRNRELIVVAKKYNIELPVTLQNLLKKRSVRTISGVSPIAILTKPFYCPGNVSIVQQKIECQKVILVLNLRPQDL
jgi:histone acetyltransferase (RNA polymerase elongator complex component)